MSTEDDRLSYSRPFADGPTVVPAVRPIYADPNYDGHPIALHATVVIPPSGEKSPNVSSLVNNEQQLIEINEIRFDILKPSATSAVTSAMQVLCKLTLGKFRITRDFVPVGLYNRRVANYESLATTGQVKFNAVTSLVWRLPVPILVDPGAVLVPTFKGAGFTNENITVKLTYMGHTTSRPIGERIRIPYLGAYLATPSEPANFVAPGAADFTVADIIEGDEQSLLNNIGIDFRCNYLTGRLFASVQTPADSQDVNADGVAVFDEPDPYYDPTVLVRIITSQGFELVPDLTPFNLVFGQERAFECELLLPPDQFITVETQFTPLADITPATPFPWEQVFVQVGMVGSYVVDLANIPEAN